jgi:hypothetical protein
MGKGREPQITLKTDTARSSWSWAGDVLEVSVRNGRWVLTYAPAKPVSAPPPVQHYFSTEE